MKRLLFISFVSIALLGCLDAFVPQPLPEDKKSLAGCWQSADQTIYFMASPDGSGRYASPSLSIQAPLRFNGSQVNVGMFGIERTLLFEKLPSEFPKKDAFVANGTVYEKIDCRRFPASKN